MAHIIGRQFSIRSEHPDINDFIQQRWHNRQNKIHRRIYDWTRSFLIGGEWFFAFFTQPDSGMQTVRMLPIKWIDEVSLLAKI